MLSTRAWGTKDIGAAFLSAACTYATRMHSLFLYVHSSLWLAGAREGDRKALGRFHSAVQELRSAGCKLRHLNLGQNALPPSGALALATLISFSASVQDLQLRGAQCERGTWKPFEMWHKVLKGLQTDVGALPTLQVSL